MTREDFVWSYVDIDQDTIKSLQEYVIPRMDNRTHFFQTAGYLNIKEFLGRKVSGIVIVRMEPHSIGEIHVDIRRNVNKDKSIDRSSMNGLNKLALNIPLMNCDNTFTEFFEPGPNSQHTKLTMSGDPYYYWDRSKSKLLTRVKPYKPVLLRTDIPHCGYNKENPLERRVLSLRFFEDPWDLVGL